MAKAPDSRESKASVRATARSARAAERERKRNATDPADMGRMRQIAVAYQRTHEYDKALPYLLIGSFLLPVVVGVLIGVFVAGLVSSIILGVAVGVLLAMLMLVRRTKAATYKRYAGQAGSAEVALAMLPKKWISAPAIAANRQLDAVHRTLGPGGLVLIGEGEPGRLKNLLASEARKHEKIAYGVKVTTIMMGTKEGQVPLEKLADHIRKLPKVLEPNQITEIKSRLAALDAIRPQIPVPKGPMPTSPRQARGARQAMRGR
jgi:F0F1-type ATP synthase assembly protein I